MPSRWSGSRGGAGLEALRVRIRDTRIEGVSYETTPGFPKLPYLEKLVAVPLGAKDVALTVDPGATMLLDTASLVEWAQRMQPGQAAPPEDPVAPWPAPDAVALDASVVAGTTWPSSAGGIAGTSTAAGWQLVRIRLHPLRWTAGSGELVLHESMSFKVSWSGGRTPKIKDEAAAFQAKMLKGLVANPDAIVIPALNAKAAVRYWPYLVISDDRTWEDGTAALGLARPGITQEFARLAKHRTKRGLRARVITVSSIVDGTWGDFSVPWTGDTQSRIRNFLRFARSKWKTRWVLLGGNYEIVPPHSLLGFGGDTAYWLGTNPKPDKGYTYWDAESGRYRIHLRQELTNTDSLYSEPCSYSQSEKVLTPGEMPGKDNPGWAFALDDTYSAVSVLPTEYVVVGGVAHAKSYNGYFFIRRRENDIPTDLAFSSLAPNRFFDNLSFDSATACAYLPAQADPWPDLIVGRAPVANQAEAKAFVDKVIAYDNYDGLPLGFSSEAVLASDNWAPTYFLGKNADPAKFKGGEYLRGAGDDFARLRFPEVPAGFWSEWALYTENAGVRSAVDYSTFFSTLGPGLQYSWCSDEDCTAPSLNLGPDFVPYPKQGTNAYVGGPAAQLEPDAYVLDMIQPDSSLLEKAAIAAIWSDIHPWIGLPDRIYADFLDAPDYPAANMEGSPWTNLMPRLSEGFNVASLSGHGSWNGCCGLAGTSVGTLTNGVAGGLVYADSCLTGEFDVGESAFGSLSTAERMVTTATGGSAAYIGNSRFSWVGFGKDYEQRFWKLMTETPYPAVANALSKLGAPPNVYGFWTNASLTYFGDPAMALWRSNPEIVSVFVPGTIAPKGVLSLDLSNASGADTVTVTSSSGYFETRSVASVRGTMEFQPKTKVGDELEVVITGAGMIPTSSKVQVVR